MHGSTLGTFVLSRIGFLSCVLKEIGLLLGVVQLFERAEDSLHGSPFESRPTPASSFCSE